MSVKSIKRDPLFKRVYQHADKRLVFDSTIPRSKQVPAYKRFFELENKMLMRYHRNGESGRRVCTARAIVLDVIIENLFVAALDTYAARFGQIPAKMAVLATGGYGRAELNPHSDIDIMFLYPRSVKGGAFENYQGLMAEEVLYPLWDLGLKVGHGSRNVHEVIAEARNEIQSKNAFLESRFITGSKSLYDDFESTYDNFIRNERTEQYIEEHLAMQNGRHQKFGNTVFLQEPDVKNGCGGLRDYQTILWLARIKLNVRSLRELQKAGYLRLDEDKALAAAYDFLLRVRTELHLGSRRPTDHLDLETQPKVALGLGFKQENIFHRVEAFMREYYSAAQTIFRTSRQLQKRLARVSVGNSRSIKISFRETIRAHRSRAVRRIDGFILEDGVLYSQKRNPFKLDPERLVRVFRILQQTGAEMDFDLEYIIARSLPLLDHKVINSPSAARSFLSILSCPGEVSPILNKMHDLGVLGRYIPEFGRLSCMVQHEYYHRYTADKHVLKTIAELDRVFSKDEEIHPDYEKQLRRTSDPALLYLILLLHDIGKSEGIKGHAAAGVKIALPILERFGVPAVKYDKINFIIRNHLEMARFWQRFDLDDPDTTTSFAKFVHDSDKLRYLYVHTLCDARGTAPSLWNGYKDSSHRTLFKRTMAHLSNDRKTLSEQQKEERAMLLKQLVNQSIDGIENEEVEAHFSLLPERYFVNATTDDISLHIRMVHDLLHRIQNARSVGSLIPVIDWSDDRDQNLSVVTVVTWDRAGLFYKLAGALSVAGVNILSTKAISRADHITIDTFYVTDPKGGGIIRDSKVKSVFKDRLEEALVHNKDLLPEILEQERKAAKGKTREERDLLIAPFPPSVEVYHELSLKRTIIEVQANDRIGLLYRLSRLIFEKGFDITFARISTERKVAMDTFYIENINSQETTNTQNLLLLREGLNAIVNETKIGS